MGTVLTTNTKWSLDILLENDWKNADELFQHLKEVPANKFLENNFAVKEVFIQNIRKLIISIERDGDFTKEAREMTRGGSILESLAPDYLLIRQDYIKKRRQLKNQMALINLFLR